nr:putative laccase-9 [Quercus suber]
MLLISQLAEKNFTKLCNTTSKLVVNGSIPGPVIQVHKGDTVYVNVHNQGYYGVTIHWHGVKQPRNPWSDGPEYITQCPIEPGSNFTYEVIFSTEEGTLWWHAHSDWTRAYVHGAIVILPTIGTTYPFTKPDDEDIIILGSLYRGNLKSELDYALIYGDDLPHSIGYTINGEPGDLCPCSKETTYRRVVDHGKTYLLRLVNSVVAANMFFAIAEHNLTIVGIDASYIKPITTSYIMIAAGQTMDILLTANQTLGHYYIAARQFWSQEVDLTNFDESNVTAIIEYRGNYTIPSSPSFPSTLPNYKDSRAAIKFSSLLRSLASKDHPVNVPLNITTRMNITGVYTTDFPDQPPYYYNFTADEIPEALEIADLGSKVKVLNYNEAVEVVFQGVWFWHCHVDRHMTWGMAAVFIVKNGGTAETSIRKPPPYLPPCKVPLESWLQNNDGSDGEENQSIFI